MDWKQGSDSEKSEKKPKMNDSEHQCHFTDYNLNEKWAYADYKYMIELVDSKIKLQPDV
jgi:ribosomal protein S18